MSLSIRKTWAEMGNPQQPGQHSVPDVGKVINISDEHIAQAQRIGESAIAHLGFVDSNTLVPQWEILEIQES